MYSVYNRVVVFTYCVLGDVLPDVRGDGGEALLVWFELTTF